MRSGADYLGVAAILLAIGWYSGNILNSTPPVLLVIAGLVGLFFHWLIKGAERKPPEAIPGNPYDTAEQHLHAAHSYMATARKKFFTAKEIIFEDPVNEFIQRFLSPAATHVHHARVKDQQASITVNGETYTIDKMAAIILYLEASFWHESARIKSVRTGELIKASLGFTEDNKALVAIDKALTYSDTAPFHLLRAQILASLNRRHEARLAIDTALHIDPYNADVLRMRDNLA